jgi:hypothetical protein
MMNVTAAVVREESQPFEIAQGRFPFDRLIQFYSLEEINQAAEDAEKGAVLKPLLCTEQT